MDVLGSLGDHIKRKLQLRHVQLIAIGGSIGTGLFLQIGIDLTTSGPLGLLLSFAFWTVIILMLTVSVGEMVSFLPVASPFVTLAGRCVDEAFECCVGFNFFIMQALYIPFEIVAVNNFVHYWRDDYSAAITLCVQIVLYAAINVFAVKLYGEVEFWLSLGKLVLCIGLLLFTLVSMCGGNPQHDAFGFRNWHAVGGPIAEYRSTGSLGRFEGFLSGLIGALFIVVGPEYMSMVAGEAVNPRKNMPTAFKTVLYRLALVYIGGALSVTILVAYNDPDYLKTTTESTSASSPYVVGMTNLGIKVLPDIVNAVVLTSAFSAGNSYTFCSSRALYGLAERGFVPRVFTKCTKKGVPIYCIAVSMLFSLLSLLQLGSSSAIALNYMVNLCTGAQLLNYGFMVIIYYKFYQAVKAQGLDRRAFAYRSWLQPYTILISGFFIWIMIFVKGYTCFKPFSVDNFLFNYVMIFVSIIVYVFWKVFKRTKMVKPEEADLVTGIDEIEEHEYEYYAQVESESGKDVTLVRRLFSWVF
ncbi:hypothetical protein CANTEDRAFT_113802 [Yamadazyma tenuis ATCC 10573]|uniref:Amino acid permease/ SLC12A domain-containing protein n=1 Tax=Candida tenuis (strain ATCC 10573 / BCRC 21748 / CBS 615 / JCM 9827 / NBRC 10315 / NRRL Y-1498 / VKM Y-70) TaxID=590646 RepID=G3B425_CANTC|nr:uncharacterized protein CANTEDRAFT_113802 [Yamadazyma tenuis ATCC 10573]EGV64238.1 hypothetical protein CANTEDRAFT_113802 [Yamadazyma tenuis ATCC 10573]